MNKLIAVILILLTFTPAQAAPAGPATVVVATCGESIVIWRDASPDAADTLAVVIWDASIHGVHYPFAVYYQLRAVLDNGRAVYQSVDWQPLSLKAESMTVAGGAIQIIADGRPVQELDQIGTTFRMDCRHVYVPVVVR